MAGARVAMALVMAVLVMCGGGVALAANLVPAVYVFGDSTVDVGNDGPQPLPYGIDLPHEYLPTGRASNGYNVADYISRLLGFKMSPPAYLSLTPETSHEILRGFGGVNYASFGSGILNTTRLGANSISMAEQVEFFAATKSKMTQYTGGGGSDAIDTLISKSFFLISAGGNDLIFTLPFPGMFPILYNDLLNSYTKHVQTLYDLGARRFGIIDVPPIGCLPMRRSWSTTGACLGVYNELAKGLNNLLGERMVKLATDPERPGMTYSVGSSYNLVTNFTADPEAAGFRNVTSACCGSGRFELKGSCRPGSTVCDNRADYLFWDFVHATQATAKKGAAIIFSAPVEEGFAKPINFQQLVSSTSTHGYDGVSSS